MCLVIFAHQPGTETPLIVAANRDEFHERPTAASAFWAEHPDVFAGRDLQAGGTWMGVNREGRFAAITNYRDPDQTKPAPRSRGELPLQFLCEQRPVEAFLEKLTTRVHEYAGFNLLVGDEDNLWYLTNSDAGSEPELLEPGIYGLSNARLDTPWPKVQIGKAALSEILQAGGALSHSTLATTVGDRELASAEALQTQGQTTQMEQLLSAQFIVTPGYGTRSRTTMWRERSGQLQWREQSFNAQGELAGEQRVLIPGR